MAVKPFMLGRMDGNTNFSAKEFVAATGVTINKGDFVYFDGDGEVTNASITAARTVGMAMETVVGDDSKKVKICIDPLMIYAIDNDNDSTTFAANHVGTYFNLTGATGAQKVDTSTTSATIGQLVCIEYNPQVDPIRSDTSWGAFVICNSFAQSYTAAA